MCHGAESSFSTQAVNVNALQHVLVLYRKATELVVVGTMEWEGVRTTPPSCRLNRRREKVRGTCDPLRGVLLRRTPPNLL